MKTTQTIKDFYGKVIGFIEIYDDGHKIVKDFYRKVVGRYDPRTNTTKDFYGKVVAKGDATAMLLNQTSK